MPLVTDEEALQAFKKAFGLQSTITKKDAKIRVGKVILSLEHVEKAIAWASEAGFTQTEISHFAKLYNELANTARQLTGVSNPNMKALETLKFDCRNLADTIRKQRTKQKLTGLPDNAGIYVHDVPGLDDLDDNARKAKILETRQKVCRGSNLTASILQGDGNYDGVAPTKETVVDMCWYFKGIAQEKLGTPYQEGAMTLPDPDGRLAKFLDMCPDIYPRDSSHLRPQQGSGQSQGRGIDVPGAFPGDMNTVLMHPYVTEQGERRLYVKFEKAGAYGHLRTTKREVPRRPENDDDERQSANHTKSFTASGNVEVEATREGTVDLAVQAAYQAIYDAAPDFRNLLDPGKQKSKQNAQGEVTGFTRALSFTPFAPNYWDVQQQSSNLRKMFAIVRNDDKRMKELQKVLQDWVEAMKAAEYHLDMYQRLGDEVVLQPNDLQPVQSNTASDGDIDGDRALIKMYDLFLQQRANQARLLEGRKKDTFYVFYGRLNFVDKAKQRQTFDNVLLVDTQVKQFEDYIEPNSKVVVGSIDKGSRLTRKYFNYVGNVTQQEMFSALQQTGWKLANLTKATDLDKKG